MSVFTRDDQLASGLEASLRGGVACAQPGASPELRDLPEVAGTLAIATQAVAPSAAFRSSARARLLAHMAATTPPSQQPAWHGMRRRAAIWCARFAAGLTALSLAGAATASASANALPG